MSATPDWQHEVLDEAATLIENGVLTGEAVQRAMQIVIHRRADARRAMSTPPTPDTAQCLLMGRPKGFRQGPRHG